MLFGCCFRQPISGGSHVKKSEQDRQDSLKETLENKKIKLNLGKMKNMKTGVKAGAWGGSGCWSTPTGPRC
jgi:hypothetical protein